MSFVRLVRTLLVTAALTVGLAASSQASVIVYDSGTGLSASADFNVSGSTLTILLTNTSTAPFGGQDGSANMVLSSLSFDLPTGVNITGGTVALGSGSNIVMSTNTTAWAIQSPTNFNSQYGYSNVGVGNTGGGSLVNATNSVTSHSNGGSNVITFTGATGLPGGLDWGLVPNGSSDIGNNTFFIQNSVLLTLTLSAPLADLSFLANGSYVEFGSDYLYIPNTPGTPVPEPASLLLVGSGALALAARARRRRRQ